VQNLHTWLDETPISSERAWDTASVVQRDAGSGWGSQIILPIRKRSSAVDDRPARRRRSPSVVALLRDILTACRCRPHWAIALLNFPVRSYEHDSARVTALRSVLRGMLTQHRAVHIGYFKRGGCMVPPLSDGKMSKVTWDVIQLVPLVANIPCVGESLLAEKSQKHSPKACCEIPQARCATARS
jgi:hypothetical protein